MKTCKECKFWSRYGTGAWGDCNKLTGLDNGKFIIYAETENRKLIDVEQTFLDTKDDFGCELAE